MSSPKRLKTSHSYQLPHQSDDQSNYQLNNQSDDQSNNQSDDEINDIDVPSLIPENESDSLLNRPLSKIIKPPIHPSRNASSSSRSSPSNPSPHPRHDQPFEPALRVLPICHRQNLDEISLLAPSKLGPQSASTAHLPLGHIKLILDENGRFSLSGEFRSVIADANHHQRGPDDEKTKSCGKTRLTPRPSSKPITEHHQFSFSFSNLVLPSTNESKNQQHPISLTMVHNGTSYNNVKMPVFESNWRVAVSPAEYADEGNFSHISMQFVDDNDVELCYLRFEPAAWYDPDTMLNGHWSYTGSLPVSLSNLPYDPHDAARIRMIELDQTSEDDEDEDDDDEDIFIGSDTRDDILEEERAVIFTADQQTRRSTALHDFLKEKQTDRHWLTSFEDEQYVHTEATKKATKNRTSSKHFDPDFLTEFALLQWKHELMMYGLGSGHVSCDWCGSYRRLPCFVDANVLGQFHPLICSVNPDTSQHDCSEHIDMDTKMPADVWEADDCCGVCELPAKGRLPGNISWHRDQEAKNVSAYRKKLAVIVFETAGEVLPIHTYHTTNLSSTRYSRCYLADDPCDDPDPMIACNGPCLRSFHLSCIAWPNKIRRSGDTQWYCSDCRRGYQHCFICGLKGKVGITVRRCEAVCGHYFHPQCMPSATTWHPRVGKYIFHVERRFWQWLDDRGENGDLVFDGDEQESDVKKSAVFICPSHWCHHCGFSGEGRLLMRCLKCPVAYHGSDECRPRNVHHVTEWSFVCHSHGSSAKTKKKADKREQMNMTQGRPGDHYVPSHWLECAQETERRIGLRSPIGEFCTAALSRRNEPLFRPIFEYRYPMMPLQLKNRTLLSLGSIVIDRHGFHNSKWIYPVGYKSLFHLMVPDFEPRLLLCSIVDDGEKPLFRIELIPTATSFDDRSRFVVQQTYVSAWSTALKSIPEWFSDDDEVQVKRKKWNRRLAEFDKSQTMAADVFGFSDPAVKDLISNMPMSRFCIHYRKRKSRSRTSSKSSSSKRDRKRSRSRSPSPSPPRSPVDPERSPHPSPSKSTAKPPEPSSPHPVDDLEPSEAQEVNSNHLLDPSQSITEASVSSITPIIKMEVDDIAQPSNQSIDQSNNQSINQTNNQTINHSNDQLVTDAESRSDGKKITQLDASIAVTIVEMSMIARPLLVPISPTLSSIENNDLNPRSPSESKKKKKKKKHDSLEPVVRTDTKDNNELTREQKMAQDDANAVWLSNIASIRHRHVGMVQDVSDSQPDEQARDAHVVPKVQKLDIYLVHPCPLMPTLRVLREVSIACPVTWDLKPSNADGVDRVRAEAVVQYVRSQSRSSFPRQWNQALAFGSPPDQLVSVVEKCREFAAEHQYVRQWMSSSAMMYPSMSGYPPMSTGYGSNYAMSPSGFTNNHWGYTPMYYPMTNDPTQNRSNQSLLSPSTQHHSQSVNHYSHDGRDRPVVSSYSNSSTTSQSSNQSTNQLTNPPVRNPSQPRDSSHSSDVAASIDHDATANHHRSAFRTVSDLQHDREPQTKDAASPCEPILNDTPSINLSTNQSTNQSNLPSLPDSRVPSFTSPSSSRPPSPPSAAQHQQQYGYGQHQKQSYQEQSDYGSSAAPAP